MAVINIPFVVLSANSIALALHRAAERRVIKSPLTASKWICTSCTHLRAMLS